MLTLGSQETSGWVLLPAGIAPGASADVSSAYTREELGFKWPLRLPQA